MGRPRIAILLVVVLLTVNILVGCVGTSEGTAEQAIQDYDEAIRLNPQDADAYYNRTLAHTFLDMDVEAEQDFNRAVKLGVPPDILKRDIEILQSQR